MVKVKDVEVPEGLHYSKDFEWVKIEGSKVRIGITDYAQKQLREIVYVELPSEGDAITQNEPYGTVESVKAVSDLVAPLSGTIEQINGEVQSSPELLNEDPYGKGWILKIKPNNWLAETKSFYFGEEVINWSREEITRIKDFLVNRGEEHDPGIKAVILQEGGEIRDYPLSEMNDEIWHRFELRFLNF